MVGLFLTFETSEVLRLWKLHSSCGVYNDLYTVMMKPFPGSFLFSIHLKSPSMCQFLLLMLAIRMTDFYSYVLLFVFPADTIHLFYNLNSSVIQVPLLKTGNSWWTDKNVKFRNPKSYNLSSAFAGKNGSTGFLGLFSCYG